MENILVSIVCASYNHKKYIAQTIEGFLMQKVPFQMEILINDDASPDGTAEIIKEYEEKYPTQIKGIYQEENQFSKGKSPFFDILFPMARGKYIAICEGDDYWTDPLKLQKQIDYMEKNPDCTYCFTNAMIVDDQNQLQDKVFLPFSEFNKPYFYNRSKKYFLGEMALLGAVPTTTVIFQKSILNNAPKFFKKKYQGNDIKLRLFATAKGYAYYLNEITGVYRMNVPTSATTSWKKYDKAKRIQLAESYIELLNHIDDYSNHQYVDELDILKLEYEYRIFVEDLNKSLWKNKRFRKKFKTLDNKTKTKLFIKMFFPKVAKNFQK